jgi:hypothetical protein
LSAKRLRRTQATASPPSITIPEAGSGTAEPKTWTSFHATQLGEAVVRICTNLPRSVLDGMYDSESFIAVNWLNVWTRVPDAVELCIAELLTQI